MKFQLGIAGFLCGSALAAQTIAITFNGALNGAPISLDSILVMNLTQGGDTTIYFPKNVLVLSAVGIEESAQMQTLPMDVLPNPFDGSTDVEMEATGGELLLTLRDATGRELTSYVANMAAGGHRFHVSCNRPGVHLLTAVQGGVSRTVRLIATEGAGVAFLSYTGEAGRALPKEDRSLFTWAAGDELRYIGYASSGGVLHSDAIDEVPEASATRSFMVLSGVVCRSSPKLADIDGNEYRAVQIGEQCWMAENLRTTRYSDGASIPQVTDGTAWAQLSSAAWCNFGNDVNFDATYGKLYNWFAAAEPSICPQGWHLPTDSEWQELELALGMPPDELNVSGFRGSAQNVGGRMKTMVLWNDPNSGATNEIGFAGLPCGYRTYDQGMFDNLGVFGYYWSTTESGANNAWARGLYYNNIGASRDAYIKRTGFCLRCVRD
jgi:uncharacterized protein (TIGR02145 family)